MKPEENTLLFMHVTQYVCSHYGKVSKGNGLLLFRHAPSRKISYIVCNPATEQWAAVPSEHTPADKHDGARRTYLVFDPAVSSHFQLVSICAEGWCLAPLHSYSSKTGVWRHNRINWAEVIQLGHWRGVSPQISATVSNAQVAVVDVEGKIRGVIPAPSSAGRHHIPLFIGQSQGSLYCIFEELCADDFPSGLSIGLCTRDFDHDRDLLVSRDYDVVAIHPDRNLVFIFLYGKRQLISLGLDSNEVHALGTLEQDPLWFTPYVPCFLDFLSVLKHDEKLKGRHELSRKDVIRAGERSGQ
ncbi:hypothetical protein PVAP13_2KG084516 [Panicum virgatum]|uniref:F-box protein At3g26010-like beta-propeller domain-containing protein n=1 Tax=Panicum virgatum TaxID=38727 RepID=A0A8T0W1D5_PANVG|nr:hypothetical protein PVAP13_2KG084516 [Panicum virgatum]